MRRDETEQSGDQSERAIPILAVTYKKKKGTHKASECFKTNKSTDWTTRGELFELN
jgi:hypothetical protein